MDDWDKRGAQQFRNKLTDDTNTVSRDGYFEVDITRIGHKLEKLKQHLSSRIIGQPRAVEHIVRAFQREKFKNPSLPIGAFLFAGPPGVGKTETAKEIARYVIGDVEEAPLIRIDCSQYSEPHQISALIGSPPGYIGADKSPLLSFRNIADPFIKAKMKLNPEFRRDHDKLGRKWEGLLNNKNNKGFKSANSDSSLQDYIVGVNAYYEFEQKWKYKSVILFDEVEKADKALWHILLSILAEGHITLNSIGNETVLFNNSIIVLTTNIGSHELQRLITDSAIGFKVKGKEKGEKLDKEIYREVKRALEKKFPPELLSRLKEDIVVFRHFNDGDYMSLVDTHLGKIRQRFYRSKVPLKLSFTPEFKQMLIEKGVDKQYGARVLNQKIEKYVVEPVSIGIGSGQIFNCDDIMFDFMNEEIKLYAKRAGAIKAIIKEEEFGIN